MNSRNTQTGFTLLEMLLAVMIFAMLGMSTYTVLSNTIDGSERLTYQNQQLTDLQRAMTIIESDFVQIAQRHARVNGEEPLESLFQAQEYLFDSEGVGFAFVRDGWTNPAMVLPRSELQPVAYRVFENRLERLYFNFVDPEMGAEPRIQPLLEGVSELQLRYKNSAGSDEWLESLPEKGLPLLVKVNFTTETFGKIERIFALPTLLEKSQDP